MMIKILFKIFNRYSENFTFLTLLVLTLTMSGCFYVHQSDTFKEEKLTEIIVGKTTKDKVIELLGEPSILIDRHSFIYKDLRKSSGEIVIFFAGGGDIPLKWRRFVLLLCFDHQNIVKRYEIESAKAKIGWRFIPQNLEKGPNRLDGELLLKSYKVKQSIFRIGAGIDSIAISPDNRIIIEAAGFASLDNNKICIKNLVTGELRVIDTPAYSKAVFSPDIKRVALINGGTVTILESETRKTLLIYKGHDSTGNKASCLAFNQADQFIASGGYQGDIHIWDSVTGRQRVNIKGHNKKRILAIAWSHDGRLLATSGLDGSVNMWDTTTGDKIFWREIKAGALSFSPDNALLAINCGGHVELWRLKQNSKNDLYAPKMELYDVFLLPYYTYYSEVYSTRLSLDFSPNGKFLAASNGGVIVYNINKRKKVSQIIPSRLLPSGMSPNNLVHTLVFSPDGKKIMTGTNDGIYSYPVLFTQNVESIPQFNIE